MIYADSTITLNSGASIHRKAIVLSPFVPQPDGSFISANDEFDFSPSAPVQSATYGCLNGSNALSNFSTTGNVSITNAPGSPAILLTKSSPSSASTGANIPGSSSILVFQYAWPNAFDPAEAATFTIDFTSAGQTTLLFQSAASDPAAHSTTLLPQTVAIPANLQGQQGVLRFLLTPSSTDTVLSQVMIGDFATVQTPMDTTPPVITVAARPSMLWPPNGKMVSVTVTGTITDSESGGTGVNPSTAMFSVTDEYGQVQPGGHLTLNPDGSYAFKIQLLASRDGGDLDGRHYTITVSAQDNAGNKTSAATVVTVPHDQGKHM